MVIDFAHLFEQDTYVKSLFDIKKQYQVKGGIISFR